jgi:hypothetical protein
MNWNKGPTRIKQADSLTGKTWASHGGNMHYGPLGCVAADVPSTLIKETEGSYKTMASNLRGFTPISILHRLHTQVHNLREA